MRERRSDRPVEVHAYAERVVLRQGDAVSSASIPVNTVASEIAYDPWHYVPVLACKPGKRLRDNGAPFKDLGSAGNALERVRRRAEAGTADGDRQMVKPFSPPCSTDGLPAVEAACAERRSPEAGSPFGDVIINIPRAATRSGTRGDAQHLHPGRAEAPACAGRRLRPVRPTQEGLTMERTEVIEMMGELKLYGMKSAYDEIYATALKRQHEPQRLVGDLLKAEISEKHARSIRYQLAIAKLPLAKDVDDFQFSDTPVDEGQVRDLASGEFIAQQRNVVLVGGPESDS